MKFPPTKYFSLVHEYCIDNIYIKCIKCTSLAIFFLPILLKFFSWLFYVIAQRLLHTYEHLNITKCAMIISILRKVNQLFKIKTLLVHSMDELASNYGQYPHIGLTHGIKHKAAIVLLLIYIVEMIAALFFIPCVRPFWGYCPIMHQSKLLSEQLAIVFFHFTLQHNLPRQPWHFSP